MAHIFFVQKARIDAIGRTSILFFDWLEEFSQKFIPGSFSGRWIRISGPNLEIKNGAYTMADKKFKKFSFDWNENEYSGVFEISDYEATLEILKFNMVDLIWWTKM